MHADILKHFVDVELFGVADEWEIDAVARLFPEARISRRGFPRRWFLGQGLSEALEDAASRVDVFHAHMLWDHPVYAAWRASRKAKKPLVITPHGSLSHPSRHRAAHKRIYKRLVLDRMFAETAALHVLNPSEETACREFGVTCPIRVIPNGLPEAEYGRIRDPNLALERWPNLRGRRVLFYMGRLWSGKGVDVLVDAWAKSSSEAMAADWLLVLAGPDYRNYKSRLLSRVASLGLDEKIAVVGPVSGELKDSLLAVSDCFVLPSFGEGFSMSFLEAVAAGLPAVYTKQCNFPELSANGGGWEVEACVANLSEVLSMVIGKDTRTLQEVGRKGRDYTRIRYTLERVGIELIAMYHDAIRR